MPLVARLGSANKSLFEVISLMENNIEEPLSRESSRGSRTCRSGNCSACSANTSA